MLKKFTDEEFAIVAHVIITQDQNDARAYTILKRLLNPVIYQYCSKGKLLYGFEDDLFHEIYMRVTKKFVSNFWERKDKDGNTDHSAKFFCRWLRVLAKNYLNDAYQKAMILKKPLLSLEDLNEVALPVWDTQKEQTEEERELLTYAFSIVLDADSDIHIILTWLGISLFILESNEEKFRVNQPFIDTYDKKTLYEMRDLLYRSAGKIDWIVISDRQKEKIDTALDFVCPDGRKMGQRTYGEFFMTKGPKATVSDWYYRMNRKIQKVIENETYNS